MTPQEEMTICAVRYSLGRSSYVVDDTIQWVKALENKSKNFLHILKRDIAEHLTLHPDMPHAEEWRLLETLLN